MFEIDVENVDRGIEMFILDIFVAIHKIKFVVKDFDDGEKLLYSFKDWDTVIREFEIIGEASKYLLKSDLLDKGYRKVVDFRNKITHNYFGIDTEIVLLIAKYEIDELLDVIIDLINNIDEPLREEVIDSFIEDNKYLDFMVKELEKLKRDKNG